MNSKVKVTERYPRINLLRFVSYHLNNAFPIAADSFFVRIHIQAKKNHIFEARGLSKVYKMGEVEVVALKDVDFDLFPGEMMVLLGASGSGKSTLLNILGGLDTPTSGSVMYEQTMLSEANESELTQYRRKHVGFVFQFYNLIPSLTARENVALVTEISDNPMTPEEALGLVGLSDRMDHFPAQLSGGEQQRVAIARAVAKKPHVLLCDEPTGALDVETGKIVLKALDRVNREVGTAIAIITHNAAIAAMGDRVVQMSSGRIVENTINTERMSLDKIVW
ncbi:ABC transporter ATP-binding protein [bacterium]|nr:ABC transporter ATP-binding protein [bacterium]